MVLSVSLSTETNHVPSAQDFSDTMRGFRANIESVVKSDARRYLGGCPVCVTRYGRLEPMVCAGHLHRASVGDAAHYLDPGPPNDQSTSNVDGQPYGRPGTPDDECLGRSTRGPDRRGRSRIAVRIVRVDGTVGLRGTSCRDLESWLGWGLGWLWWLGWCRPLCLTPSRAPWRRQRIREQRAVASRCAKSTR